MNEPLISVIIPFYNRSLLLMEAMDSLMAQTYTNWECILVDDGSEESHLSAVKNYILNKPQFKLLHRPLDKAKGANTCRNLGYKEASGTFIQWFDSDDIMAPQMLRTKVNQLLTKDIDFVVSRVSFFRNSLAEPVENHYLLQSDKLLEDFLDFKVRFYTPGPLFRRTFLEQQNELFDESLQRNQESAFFFRLLLQNPKISFLEENLAYVRVHEHSISGKYEQKEIAERAAKNIQYLLSCLQNYKAYKGGSNGAIEKKIIDKIRSYATHANSLSLLIKTYRHLFKDAHPYPYSRLLLYMLIDFLKVVKRSFF